MAKTFKPVVLTANALEGGEAVWWTGAGWSPRFAEACSARSAEEAALFETLAAAPMFERMVVGPYLAEVEVTEQGLNPGDPRRRGADLRLSRGRGGARAGRLRPLAPRRPTRLAGRGPS